ncbi:uncharacterized protein LOC143035789 [Oratosquilla oratoria]|uniref:uncharacterized protein LOC143035789 n=1 Tax=Oratosquilla oratoria TaxID=337810 RepID=UPI003F760E8E
MANMGNSAAQEMECHHLWRGQLIIGMKNIGSATIWSQCSSYVPALGGKLCLRYSNNIHHLWRRILRMEPVQLSYKEPVKVGNKMVSAYAITSHQAQFIHLAQELCSERKILVDTILNPGISVEVVVAPACTLMESWGLKGNEHLPQPVLHILFITNSQQSTPYVSYRDQRNFILKNNGTSVHQDGIGMLKTKRAGAQVLAQVSTANLTRPQKCSQNFKGKSDVKPGQTHTENKPKEFTSVNVIASCKSDGFGQEQIQSLNPMLPYSKDNILEKKEPVVHTKHDLTNKTHKKKNKSKMLMLDTQKLHNVFRRKDKSRPDIIRPSMLKKTKKLNKDPCQGHPASNTKLENTNGHITTLPDVVGSMPSQNKIPIPTDVNESVSTCSTPENSLHKNKEMRTKNSSTSKSNLSVADETGENIKGKKPISSSSILLKTSREKENSETTRRNSTFSRMKEVVLSIAGKRKPEEGKVGDEKKDDPVEKKLRVLKNFEMPGSKCKPKKLNKKIASLEKSQEASCYPKILERFYCSISSKTQELDEHVDQKLGMKIGISSNCSELKQGRNLEQKSDRTDSFTSHPQQSVSKNTKLPNSTIMKRNEDFFIALEEQDVKRTSVHSSIELESAEVTKKYDPEVERECDPAIQGNYRSLDIADGSQLSKTSLQVIAEEERDLIILESARECKRVVDNELESALDKEPPATQLKIENRSAKDSIKNENLKIKQQIAKQDPKPLIDDSSCKEECPQQLRYKSPGPLKGKKTCTSKEGKQQLEGPLLIIEENLDSDGEEDSHLFGKEPPEISEGEIPPSFREEDSNLSMQKCLQPLHKEHLQHLEECWESSEHPQPLQKSQHIIDGDIKSFRNGLQHIDESFHSSQEVHTVQEGIKFPGVMSTSCEEFPSPHTLTYSLVEKYHPPEKEFQFLEGGVQPLGQEPWGQERLLPLREKPQSAKGLNWERVHPVENEIKNLEEITQVEVKGARFSGELPISDIDTKILQEPESQKTDICTSLSESLTTVKNSDRANHKSNSQNLNKLLDGKMLTEINVQRYRFDQSLPYLRDTYSELLRIVKEIKSQIHFHGSPGALNFWLIAQHKYLYSLVGEKFKEVQEWSQSQLCNKFSESPKTCKSWSTNTKQITNSCGLNSRPGFQHHNDKYKTLIDRAGLPEWNRFCSLSTSLERPRNLYEMECNIEKTVTKKEIIFTKLDRGYYLQSRLISLNTKGIMLLAEMTPPNWSKMGSFPTISQMMLQQFEVVYLYIPLKMSAKLEVFLATHHFSSAEDFEMKSHMGSICICLQARFIETLFWDEELLDLVLNKNIKFGVYTCLSDIEKGKSWHILCRGTLFLIHHTSLADASLGDLVEGFIADRQRMTSGHLLVLPVTTLKTSYFVLKNARNLSSYDCTIRNTMKRTVELLIKCMSQGLAVLTPNTGEWKGLDPCANLKKYLAYLPLLHRSFHYQHRIVKLITGSDFHHMVDGQKHHYYGFITATEVLEKGYLE